MEIRKLDRDNLCHEYGVLTQRLLPWPAVNAPFEGAWVVLEPGMATQPHSHHEYEIFIAVSGRAILDTGGERRQFVPGDVAYLVPGTVHQVINDDPDGDFQFYGVWWDPEMSRRFTTRHAEEAR